MELDSKYTAYAFLELKDRYAVCKDLLGQSFEFQLSDDVRVVIQLPILNIKPNPKSNYLPPTLKCPYTIDQLGCEMDPYSWGKVNSFSQDLADVDVWLGSLLFLFESSNNSEIENLINDWSKGFLRALQILQPGARRFNTDQYEDSLCKHVSVCEKTGNKFTPVIHIVSSLTPRGISIDRTVFSRAMQFARTPVNLPYLLVNQAIENMAQMDYRSTVLNCATAIEVSIRRIIEAYLSSVNVSEPLRSIVLPDSMGYNKYLEVCKKLKITLSSVKGTIIIMDLRNRVIHGGFTPSYQEISQFTKITRDFLIDNNVPMFEES